MNVILRRRIHTFYIFSSMERMDPRVSIATLQNDSEDDAEVWNVWIPSVARMTLGGASHTSYPIP